MKKTFSCLARYWPIVLAAVLSLVGECLCDLYQPTLMARMIDKGVDARSISVVGRYALGMLGVTALGMLCAIARSMFSSNASQRYGRDLRLMLYKKVMHMPLEDVDRLERASIITRLTNDVTQVQNFVNGSMRIFLRAPILCVGSIIMAYQLSHAMAGALTVVVPVSAAIIALSIAIGYPYFYKVQSLLDKLSAVVREYLSGVRVVKAFGRFAFEKKRFEGMNEGLTNASAAAMRVTAVFGPAVSLVVNIAIAAVIVLGGFAGEEKGTVVAFINYMTQIMSALAMFSRIFNQLARALVSGKRIGEVLSGGEAPQSGEERPEAGGTLAFENVSFAYTGSSLDALDAITFEARMGETIGIIGSTGTGKTTLVNLIPRFYDVTRGRITLGGIDIRDIPLAALRDKIALVPQQSLLFTGTIEDNLRWGKPDAGEEALWAALEAAQAADFVRRFPEGLLTQLGQGGVNLSGGQKQRLSIARALVKAPEILILDDATSAVDVTTEAEIRRALAQKTRGMITLTISQRITSVMGADKILVIDGGRIVSAGTHDHLMRSSELYREIYHSQIGKEAA